MGDNFPPGYSGPTRKEEAYQERWERVYHDLEGLYEHVDLTDIMVDFFEAHPKEKETMLYWWRDSKEGQAAIERLCEPEEEDCDPRDR